MSLAAALYVGFVQTILAPAQEVNLSEFNRILFLFIGLFQVAFAIALGIAVLVAILQLIGLDVLGLAKTVLRGGSN
jgi:hypothetical protein